MRSGTSSLSVLFLLGAACSQIIGLSDYDKVGDPGSGGKTGSGASGGVTNTGGGTNRGGTSTGDAGGGAGGVGGGEGGTGPGTGGSGDAGGGASNEGGRVTTGGRSSGGTVGNGGSNDGGAGDNGGGVSGDGGGGAGGDGGTTTGGTAGKGGSGGTGGASKGGSGGTSGGKGGSGGVAPNGGKGGSGGTNSGGTPGSGGKGGTCSTQELLTNPNFDGTTVAPWVQGSSEGYTVLLNSAGITSTTGWSVTPLSGTRAAVMGGLGPLDDTGYSYVSQPVTVPVGTSQLRLACSRQVRTDEAMGVAFDYLDAWLWDDGINDLAVLFEEWSNLDAVNSWTSFAYTVDATALVGNTYSFEFFALYNDEFETWFFIDNCSLQATICN